MSGGVIERRRIALAGGRGRADLALPVDESLAQALRVSGLAGSARPTVLGPDGYEIDADTLGEDLVEGGLYTLVDPDAVAGDADVARGRADEGRADHGARWVLLAVAAVLLVAAGAASAIDPLLRLIAGLVAAAGAFVSAVAWTGRTADTDTDALALRGVVAPAALSFAAGALLIPASLEAAAHLSVASGFLAAAVGTALVALLTGTRAIRAAAGTVAILLVVFGAVWGIALLLRWAPPDAAAICLGLVPLLLRALPSALVNLPDGAFIDYRHFMSNRWTVRGAIPESPTTVDALGVREVVADSWARLGSGTVVLSLVALALAPVVLLRPWGSDPFVVGGGIALLVCLVLSLLLVPRHTGSRLLRWAPRASAVGVLVLAAAAVAGGTGPWSGAGAVPPPTLLLIVASGLFLLAVLAVLVIRPVSRGARSLAWSRVGDAFEAIAVALALPAALLHADVLTLLRGMMAA